MDEPLVKMFPPDITLSVHPCTLTHTNTCVHLHKCIHALITHTIPAEPHVHTQKHPYTQHTLTYTSLPTHSPEHKYTFYTHKCLETYTLCTHTHTCAHTYPHANICPYTCTNSILMHTPINNLYSHTYLHTQKSYTHAQPMSEYGYKVEETRLHFII